MSKPVWERMDRITEEGWYWYGGTGKEPHKSPSLFYRRTGSACNEWVAKVDDPNLPEMPRPDLKMDEPVLVRGYGVDEWQPRHFAGWSECGFIQCWYDGKTSHTVKKGCTYIWPEWKLPDNQEKNGEG